ncbi:MAG: AtpZ/AtpI family protein [Bacteroidetes bacterium]|nr:AtpZ/AtpI family protein [Bacteroidota bacterium]
MMFRPSGLFVFMKIKEGNKISAKNLPAYLKMTDRFFYASLINIPIFGLPAFGALFLGKYLDNRFETGKIFLISLLAIAFISSWAIVLRRSRRITKEFQAEKEKLMEDNSEK